MGFFASACGCLKLTEGASTLHSTPSLFPTRINLFLHYLINCAGLLAAGGILRAGWAEKHAHRVPPLVVLAFPLDPRQSTADWAGELGPMP